MGSRSPVAVVGATGYAGLELVRLLARHPRVGSIALFGREGDEARSDLTEVFPHISGNGRHTLQAFSWDALATSGAEALFLATPHETSRAWVPEALGRGLRIVDLSGAWRLKCPNHAAVYKFEDADAGVAKRLTEEAVYGLPELHRGQLAGARLVANPGCYATSIILALAPLVRASLLDADAAIVCDSKSGVSGAGRQPTLKTHFVEVAGNLSAYSVFGHRHTGEMLEQLQLPAEQFTFTPHLLPIPRGILSTIYIRLREPASAGHIEDTLRGFYAGSPWVRIFAPPKLPEIQYSLHTNYCDIGFTLAPDRRRMVMVSCLDNLGKGAAGQAVQNFNLIHGWDEREGLA
jgi:N-acetyl-gamma-glutamyl-phosphate reductase